MAFFVVAGLAALGLGAAASFASPGGAAQTILARLGSTSCVCIANLPLSTEQCATSNLRTRT
eukprot:9486612-Pyramimonas_sp.AAC.1